MPLFLPAPWPPTSTVGAVPGCKSAHAPHFPADAPPVPAPVTTSAQPGLGRLCGQEPALPAAGRALLTPAPLSIPSLGRKVLSGCFGVGCPGAQQEDASLPRAPRAPGRADVTDSRAGSAVPSWAQGAQRLVAPPRGPWPPEDERWWVDLAQPRRVRPAPAVHRL